ncbi:DNA polymerase [Crangon crangon nudivirus]|uniref:DNA-directed DNA polymerase n=1 Tax=Crangon crangon nudivirus TaxID=2880838 RepID=A0AAE9BZT3_9VIRU|nr:DNA polymerase [Crangon crangon nudivirus]UBZ25485.1 DNA polymerase [Crangon crangon nudivirus]
MVTVHPFQLELRSRIRWLAKIPIVSKSLYALEWVYDDLHDEYYLVGIDIAKKTLARFKAPIKSCLYVWMIDQEHIKLLSNLKYIDKSRPIERIDGITFRNNQVTLLDELLNNDRIGNKWILYRIPTTNYDATKQLHKLIVSTQALAYHIATLSDWSVNIQALMAMYICNQDVAAIHCVTIDPKLNIQPQSTYQQFDIMTYDIETVSHSTHRVPMGEEKSDIINSIALCQYMPNLNIFRHHTFFNLPVDDPERAYELMTLQKTYKYNLQHSCHIYNTEEDLLNHFFRYLLQEAPDCYILLGYNSKGYDMPYLFRRAIYLNLPAMNNFYYRNGILLYGYKMIHIDMYQVITKYYANELDSFSLKNVAKYLLNDTQKVDLNAVDLRYIYKHMMEQGLGNGTYDEWNVDLSKMALYNDMDSILVLSLWLEYAYGDFLILGTQRYKLSLLRLPQTAIGEYLGTSIIHEGLRKNYICASHYNRPFSYNASLYVSLDIDKLVASNDDPNSSYGGGFNYRDKTDHVKNVVAMDAQAYYPQIIAGFNISHETVLNVTVDILRKLLSQEPTVAAYLSNCVIMRFCTHKNVLKDVDTDNRDLLDYISTKFYIFGKNDNASIITISQLSLLPPEERLMVINNNYRGLLADLVAHRNTIRNTARDTKKFMDKLLAQTREMLKGLDQSGPGIASFELSKFLLTKPIDMLGEIWMVHCHYRPLSTADIESYANPMASVKEYLDTLTRENIRINSIYRNTKLENNSLYGLMGSAYAGVLRGKNTAAAVTMIGRKYIVEAAKIGHSINCRLVYSDTDSVMFTVENANHPNPVEYIEKQALALNPLFMLKSEYYQDMFIIAKKKYLAFANGNLSRGINKNGPALWDAQIYEFYTTYIREGQQATMADVHNILVNMYTNAYKKIKDNNQLVLCRMSIKIDEPYKTQTPAKRLIDRITEEYPQYIIPRKIHYFHILKNLATKVHFGMDFELKTASLGDFNLYKFYSSISKTLYDILAYTITRTNFERYGIYTKYNFNTYKKDNLLAFNAANSSVGI